MNRWKRALSVAVMFTMSLAVAWLMVKVFDISWDRALQVQILWLVVLIRWYQPDEDAHNGN